MGTIPLSTVLKGTDTPKRHDRKGTMFVARERELTALERMYKRDGFQMAVIYGRRRVGKTTLIDEFAKDKRVLYFTAQQKTSHQNLELLSAATYAAFSLPATLPAFASWNDALRFVVERVGKEPPTHRSSSSSTSSPTRPRPTRRFRRPCRQRLTTASSRQIRS